MSDWPAWKKGVAALALAGACAFPVVLYDRLVAAEVLRNSRRPGRAEIPPAEIVDLYSKLYYNSAQTTWMNSHWLGVPTFQDPNDVWITQEIISETKPDFIVETGTALGGSALVWATVLEQVNPKGRVITVDITKQFDESKLPPLWKRRVDFVLGSSTSPETVAAITRRVKGASVMVLLDSAHEKPHVLNELRAYSPLVKAGNYLIVQDTNVNGHPVFPEFGPGPWEAVDEFLAENDSFRSDRRREHLLFTMHPRGYLERVK